MRLLPVPSDSMHLGVCLTTCFTLIGSYLYGALFHVPISKPLAQSWSGWCMSGLASTILMTCVGPAALLLGEVLLEMVVDVLRFAIPFVDKMEGPYYLI